MFTNVKQKMLLKNIRKGKYSLDNIVAHIGNKLPIRMIMDRPRKPLDKKAFQEKAKRIRSTFKNHKPPIIVGEHIGMGGFADVFKATSDYDGFTDFAIKILKNEILAIRKGSKINPADEEMRAKDVKKRFRNESYVQWSLSKSLSDNVADSVVKVYDHGEFDSKNDFRFILMEQMGSTLRDYINNTINARNTEKLLKHKLRLMRNIAYIIYNVHNEGIFHRDIKPENILFTKEASDLSPSDAVKNKVKLSDFGTVRWIKSYTDKYDGVIIGSQYYMSPEQIFSPENLDLRTDIYSFGVICYELLYGAHPKNINNHTTGILVKIAREKPRYKKPPKNFKGLNDIIFKCMNDIRNRYQNMGEVVKELKDFSYSLQEK